MGRLGIHHIHIGKIYEIKNFEARISKLGHRPVKSDISFRFTDSTNVKICDEDHSIPLHKFEIVKLDDLYNVAEPYEFGKDSGFSPGNFVSL